MTSSPTHGSTGDASKHPIGSGGATQQHLKPQQSVRIVTNDFPQYFAIISRCRQEVRPVGAAGCVLQSGQLPRARVSIPRK